MDCKRYSIVRQRRGSLLGALAPLQSTIRSTPRLVPPADPQERAENVTLTSLIGEGAHVGPAAPSVHDRMKVEIPFRLSCARSPTILC